VEERDGANGIEEIGFIERNELHPDADSPPPPCTSPDPSQIQMLCCLSLALLFLKIFTSFFNRK
jgi:hypothetical protein